MRRSHGLLLCLPLLATLAGCYTTHGLASTNTNQCIQVPWDGSPILAGTPVTLAQCFARSDNQRWLISNQHISGVADLCLTVQDGSAMDGTPVVAMPCSASSGQRWHFAGGTLLSSGGKCLDVPGGDIAESAPLIIAACSGAASQQWSLR